LRALERWAKRFSERRWAVENACGLGRYLAVRLAAAGECVVDVPPKLSARMACCSAGILPDASMATSTPCCPNCVGTSQ
jgi:transposase